MIIMRRFWPRLFGKYLWILAKLTVNRHSKRPVKTRFTQKKDFLISRKNLKTLSWISNTPLSKVSNPLLRERQRLSTQATVLLRTEKRSLSHHRFRNCYESENKHAEENEITPRKWNSKPESLRKTNFITHFDMTHSVTFSQNNWFLLHNFLFFRHDSRKCLIENATNWYQ